MKYRYLEPGEKVIEGDEYEDDFGIWNKSRNWIGGGSQDWNTRYRRPIKEEPVDKE